MAWFEISDNLKMTVGDLQNSIPITDFYKYCEYYNKKKLEFRVEHWYLAQIAYQIHRSIVYATSGKEKIRPFKDFLWKTDDKPESQSEAITPAQAKERMNHSKRSWMTYVSTALGLQRRAKELEKEKGLVEQIIYEGTLKMIEITNQTLKEVKSAMGIGGTWNKISRVARDRQHSASSI